MHEDGSVLERSHLEAYLRRISGKAVYIEVIKQLGGDQGGVAALKAFGEVRRKLVRFARQVLATPRFDWLDSNRYLLG